ncbi:MAG TPA: thioesterase family protein [Bryobacteraceae bacterium]|nr:thioesterase family protein [Bryobacteraceae bacterium]
MNETRDPLDGYPIVLTLPVQWGDQDAFEHVNNTVYLRWCETARVEYLVRIGLFERRNAAGIGPIMANITIDYKRPVTYPDSVRVGARVTRIGNSSFHMEHLVVSEAMNAVAAAMDSVLVVVDYTRNKPVPVPAAVRGAIEQLEGRAFETPGK